MKKVYKVFKTNEGIYYAAHYKYPFCPIFGSISKKKSIAVLACANRMCLSVKEYNSLPAVTE
jgi:hypothetical protein